MGMDLHLRQLRCFLTVAEEQQFTRAGGSAAPEPARLDQHIQALENVVRTSLFTRGRSGAQLTARTAIRDYVQACRAAVRP